LNLEAARIQGNVSFNGSTAPTANGSRGAIRFVSSDGGAALSSPLGSSGDATYGVTLLRGEYAVWLDANEALCDRDTAPPVPCLDGELDDSINVTVDGVFNLDVPTIQLSGALTLNGEILPNLSTDRGVLSFLSVANQSATSGPRLGTTGAGTYAVTLLPGHHVIRHRGDALLCDPASPPKLPCGDVVVRGCDPEN
jgi:hypothetical protein